MAIFLTIGRLSNGKSEYVNRPPTLIKLNSAMKEFNDRILLFECIVLPNIKSVYPV